VSERQRAATILVPLDGSIEATAAIPVARALADSEGATLRLLHVSKTRLAEADLLSRVRLSSEALSRTGPALIVDQSLGDRPAHGILAAADESCCILIVMCSRCAQASSSDEPAGGIGPVAAEVLCASPCPVVVVRPERGAAPWSLKRALLPIEGSPKAAAGVRPALDFPRRAGARLHVLYVAAEGFGRPSEPGSFAGPYYLDHPEYDWPAWTAEFVDRVSLLCGLPEEERPDMSFTAGDPGEEISKFASAQGIDLIVLGWHATLEGTHARTLKTVALRAPCPILIARLGERRC
jgi:nucleotide-binding universal stress UspA family protein